MSLLTALLLKSYNPDQPRDDHGKWTGGGSSDVIERVRNRLDGERQFKTESQEFDSLLNSQKVKLNEDEKDAVEDYTNNAYKSINSSLRNGASSCYACPHLDSAISKGKLKEDTELYRSADLGTAFVNLHFVPGAIVTDRAYVSTSISVKAAAGLHVIGKQNVIFAINAPRGSTGLAIPKDLGVITEREVLLPRGSRFKVSSVSDSKVGPDNSLVVTMKYLGASR